MNKDRICRAYDSMGPDQAAKERMFASVVIKKGGEARAGKRLRRVLRTAAAAAAVIAALTVTAAATGWFGLGSTMIGPQEIDMGFGQTAAADIISLQGFEESPEYMANKEWQEFLASYDSDGSILAKTGNSPTEFDAEYQAYSCYTQDMADKIEEICQKYSLKLLGPISSPQSDEELFSLAGTGEIYKRSTESLENTVYLGYVYDNGAFHFSGDAKLLDPGLNWPYPISYEFSRTMKGWFDSSTLNIGDLDDYTQWSYTTKNGVALLLAQSDTKELIMADRGASFVVVNLFDVYVGDVVYGELRKSPEALEAFAEAFDFSAIP